MNNIVYKAPKGSILGPLLIGIYLNDLSASVKCFLELYADDMQLFPSRTLENVDQLIDDTENTCKM